MGGSMYGKVNCAATGCAGVVPGYRWFCEAHWAQLPWEWKHRFRAAVRDPDAVGVARYRPEVQALVVEAQNKFPKFPVKGVAILEPL